MKLKYILSLTILFCSFIGNSQTKEQEGEIVISEENLISLIQKIKDKRDANYLLSQKSTVVTNTKSEVDLTGVNSKLETLEYKLKYLTDLLESKNATEEVSTEYYIIKNDKKEIPTTEKIVYVTDTIYETKDIVYKTNDTIYKASDTIYKTHDVYKEPFDTTKPTISTTLKGANEKPKVFESKKPTSSKNTIVPVVAKNNASNDSSAKAIERLERKIDSLFALNKTNKEIVYVNNNQPTKNDPAKVDTIYVNKTNSSNYDLLKSKYSGFVENVYFKNNSSKIDVSDKIDSTISLLNSNENLDVYLKGFASNKGNAIYNQELSFKRTETIKRYLVSKGIHPNRILSQFHGIDYESKNEAEARRVEMSFIIRK